MRTFHTPAHRAAVCAAVAFAALGSVAASCGSSNPLASLIDRTVTCSETGEDDPAFGELVLEVGESSVEFKVTGRSNGNNDESGKLTWKESGEGTYEVNVTGPAADDFYRYETVDFEADPAPFDVKVATDEGKITVSSESLDRERTFTVDEEDLSTDSFEIGIHTVVDGTTYDGELACTVSS